MLKRKPISNHFQQNQPFPPSRKKIKKYSKTLNQKSKTEKLRLEDQLKKIFRKYSSDFQNIEINEEKLEKIYVSDICEF